MKNLLKPSGGITMPVVKIRTNRQVTIPKTIFDELGLEEGQFVEVVRQQNGVFFKPKKLVDSDIEEALRDIDEGRVIGPFKTAKTAIKALKSTKP
jgi:AbrB family looped-hinge helix DNA binding protein